MPMGSIITRLPVVGGVLCGALVDVGTAPASVLPGGLFAAERSGASTSYGFWAKGIVIGTSGKETAG